MKIASTFCAIIFFCLSSLALARPCNLGKVTSVNGDASIERNGQVFSADTDILICAGDKYITDALGVVQLRLRDGSIITVGKSSEFIVKTFKIYKQKPNIALFELTKGAFRAITGFATSRPHRFEVNTAIASIGVRGTDFWGGFGLTENGLDVVMLSGKGVYVKNLQGEQVELNAEGLGTTVLSQASPSVPKQWPEAKLAKAIATITP